MVFTLLLMVTVPIFPALSVMVNWPCDTPLPPFRSASCVLSPIMRRCMSPLLTLLAATSTADPNNLSAVVVPSSKFSTLRLPANWPLVSTNWMPLAASLTWAVICRPDPLMASITSSSVSAPDRSTVAELPARSVRLIFPNVPNPLPPFRSESKTVFAPEIIRTTGDYAAYGRAGQAQIGQGLGTDLRDDRECACPAR